MLYVIYSTLGKSQSEKIPTIMSQVNFKESQKTFYINGRFDWHPIC